MYDPFPFRPPAYLADLTARVTDRLQLHTLPLHIHELLLAFLFYHAVSSRLSPLLSRALFPRTYPSLSARTRLNWDVHVCSLVQSSLVCAVCLFTMARDRERARMDWRERVWGYTGMSGLLEALGAGYFVWDLAVSLAHVDVFGLGLLAHAVAALTVFALGFRPFVNFYAPTFLLYELSSPFLNIHWFCDKLDMTGSTLQLCNGILLMASFFGARLVWGSWQTVAVFSDVFRAIRYQRTAEGAAWLAAQHRLAHAPGLADGPAAEVMRHAGGREVPLWLAGAYLGSNAVLMLLNVYWFGKMIETIRARFPPPFGTKRIPAAAVAPAYEGKRDAEQTAVVGRGVDVNGVKSVRVESRTAAATAHDDQTTLRSRGAVQQES